MSRPTPDPADWRQRKVVPHGTLNRYRRYHCRCAACVTAERECRRRLGGTRSRHGTRSRYTMGCRCDVCRAAQAAYTAGRRQSYGTGHGSLARAEAGCDCPRCERALAARDAARCPKGPPRWRCPCDPWRLNPGEATTCGGCGTPSPLTTADTRRRAS